MPTRTLAAAMLLVVLAAAPAQAISLPAIPANAGRATDDQRIAQTFWHAQPACDTPLYVATPTQMINVIGIAAAGLTTLGCNGPVTPIWLSSTYSPATVDNRVTACSTYVHEYGHALGVGHDSQPTSVMNPVAEVTVWACYHRYVRTRIQARMWRRANPGMEWATLPT